jgi:hypothetical protein
MTTKDIEILTVTVRMKDGTVAVSSIKPEFYNIIVGLCEFARVDKEKVSEVLIKDITEKR